MDWLQLASLPLAAILIIVIGWVLNRQQKQYLDVAILPLKRDFEKSVDAMTALVKENSEDIERELYARIDRLTAVVEKLIEKLNATSGNSI
jgi:phosphoserine phosphatase